MSDMAGSPVIQNGISSSIVFRTRSAGPLLRAALAAALRAATLGAALGTAAAAVATTASATTGAALSFAAVAAATAASSPPSHRRPRRRPPSICIWSATISVLYLSWPDWSCHLRGADTALDIDRRAFLQVLAGNLGQLAEEGDAVPLGGFLEIAGLLVLVAIGRRQADVRHGVAAGHVAGFRVGARGYRRE